MQRQTRRPWGLILGTTLAAVAVLAVIWTAAPEGDRGLLMLVGGVLTAVVFVPLYALQSRDHWRW